jgi:hypothetical protein
VTINSRLHAVDNGRCCGMEINLDKTKIMRISRKPFPPNIMIIKKQMNHVKYLNSLGNTITNGTVQLNSGLHGKKRTHFHREMVFKLRKKLVK